jgi:hypothetical protein
MDQDQWQLYSQEELEMKFLVPGHGSPSWSLRSSELDNFDTKAFQNLAQQPSVDEPTLLLNALPLSLSNKNTHAPTNPSFGFTKSPQECSPKIRGHSFEPFSSTTMPSNSSALHFRSNSRSGPEDVGSFFRRSSDEMSNSAISPKLLRGEILSNSSESPRNKIKSPRILNKRIAKKAKPAAKKRMPKKGQEPSPSENGISDVVQALSNLKKEKRMEYEPTIDQHRATISSKEETSQLDSTRKEPTSFFQLYLTDKSYSNLPTLCTSANTQSANLARASHVVPNPMPNNDNSLSSISHPLEDQDPSEIPHAEQTESENPFESDGDGGSSNPESINANFDLFHVFKHTEKSWFLEELYSLEYPLVDNARATTVTWTYMGNALQVNDKDVSPRTLYVLFVQEQLGLLEIWRHFLKKMQITKDDIEMITNLPGRLPLLRRKIPETERFAFVIGNDGRVTLNDAYFQNVNNDESEGVGVDDEFEDEEKQIDIILYMIQFYFSSSETMKTNGETNSTLKKIAEREQIRDLYRSFMHVIKILEVPAIERKLTVELLQDIDSLRTSNRAKITKAKTSLSRFSKEIQHVMIWALYEEILTEKLTSPFFGHPASFELWESIYNNERFVSSQVTKSQAQYLPWLLISQSSLKATEAEDVDFRQLTRMEINYCIKLVMRWLLSPAHENITHWLIQFLFKDFVYDTKRKFLFIHGSAHVGKTTFMEILLSTKWFKTRFLTNSHYNPTKKGDYYINCAIFDDPCKIGENSDTRVLGSTFWLNLGQGGENNQSFTLNTKYGFVNYHKAQICLISNKDATHIIGESATTSALHSRLLPVRFSSNNAFPLSVYSSSETHPFVFQRPPGFEDDIIFPDNEQKSDDVNSISDKSLSNSTRADAMARRCNFARIPDHPEFRNLSLHENGTITSPFLSKQVVGYCTWMAQYEVLGYNLTRQSEAALDFILNNNTRLKKALFHNVKRHNNNNNAQGGIESLETEFPSQFVKNLLSLDPQLLLELKEGSTRETSNSIHQFPDLTKYL